MIPMLRGLGVAPAVWTAALVQTTVWAAGFAQPAPQTATSRFALVTVADPRGRPIVDVGPDDFVVSEGGQSREILDARVADYPIAVVMDTSGAGADFTSMQQAIVRFVERLGPRPVAMVAGGGAPKLIASFDEERKEVLAHLKEATLEGEGQPLEAAAVAAEAISRTGALFSALVVVTASPVAVNTAVDRGATVAAIDQTQLLAPIVDSRAVVHVVAQASPASPGARMQLWRGLVEQTRGEFRAIYTAASYAPALDRLADRLTTEIVIEYLVPPGSRPNDPMVGVRLPGARVRGLGVAPGPTR